jgi:ubiquinone/menaquinone biosynthesis C-methylase UbiE
MLTLAKIRKFQRHLLDSLVRANPSIGLAGRAEFFTRLFENHLGPQSRILDIGGGWGFYADPLEKRGHSCTVLDIIKPGYQKSPVVIYNPADPFPFPDQSFDASILVTVLHHVPDPAAVLREARRVTRKTLIVVEDLYHHELGRWWTILRDQIYNFEFFGHPCQFRKKEAWLELFRASGFSPVKEDRVYTWMAGMRILNGVFVLQAS